MPTASDLVTDLPADFETFGQAVATSMADLLGGTTGQILAKNSNTDMDFVWIANDQGDITGVTASSPLTGGGTSGAITLGILSGTTSNLGAVQLSDSTSSTSTTLAATANAVKSAYDLANGAIPKTLIDAAGDLIIGTAADTAGRLAIGTNGQVLTSNGTTATWSTPAGGGGKVLQVVSAQTTTKVTIASTSLTDTGITASITPTLSTSKILVIIAANAYSSAAVDNTQVGAALLRGATTLQSWDSSKNFTVFVGGGSTGYLAVNNSVVYLDSPATTSSITYKLQANTQSTANSRQVVFQEGSSPGTITLMEIGA